MTRNELFEQQLDQTLADLGFACVKSGGKPNFISYETDVRGVYTQTVIHGDELAAKLYFKPHKSTMYHHLYEQREAIEGALPLPVTWQTDEYGMMVKMKHPNADLRREDMWRSYALWCGLMIQTLLVVFNKFR